MPQITVTIDQDGDTNVAVQGQPGPGCKQLTAAIERAIGQTTKDQTTPEMQQSAGQRQQREAMA